MQEHSWVKEPPLLWFRDRSEKQSVLLTHVEDLNGGRSKYILTPASLDRRSYFRVFWPLPELNALLSSMSPGTALWALLELPGWEPASQVPTWVGIMSKPAGERGYKIVARIWKAAATSPELKRLFRFRVAREAVGDELVLCAHFDTLSEPLLITQPKLQEQDEINLRFFAMQSEGRVEGHQDISCALTDGAGLIGYAESVLGCRVQGWFTALPNYDEPLEVQVNVNGQLWWMGTPRRLWTFDPTGEPFQLPVGFCVDLPAPRHDCNQWSVEIVGTRTNGESMRLEPLQVDAADRYVGEIDEIKIESISQIKVKGWAQDLAEPLVPVKVKLNCRDRSSAESTAKLFRSDLKAKGIGLGYHGFELEVEAAEAEIADVSVSVGSGNVRILPRNLTIVELQRAENSTASSNSQEIDLTKLLPNTVQGFVDRWSDHEVSGWARSAAHPNQPIQVDLLIDGHIFSSTFTSIFRQDIQRKFGDHGFHAFHFEIPPTYRPTRPHSFKVIPRNIAGKLSNSEQIRQPRTKGVITNIIADTAIVTKQIYRSPEFSSDDVTPLCALIVLNRNGANLLNEFFSSFHRHNSYPNVEILIIDHGSLDESEDVCRHWSENLRIRFIPRGRNYTFSESNNYGVELTDAEFIFFVNNDITFVQDIIGPARTLLRDPQVGMLGIRLLDTPVGINPFSPPLIQHLGVHYSACPTDRSLHPIETRYLPHLASVANAAWKVPTATGAFLACRRKDFEALGGFNEDYIYGYEDVDLCLGVLLDLGKDVVNANQLNAFHLRGYSRKKSGTWSGETMLANRRVLERRYGYVARTRQRADLLTRPGFWSCSAPRIAFAVTEASDATAAGDYFTAKELAEEITKLVDATIIYLEKNTSWYDLAGIDILVVMCHDYNLNEIVNAAPHLLKIGWARNWIDIWAGCGSSYNAIWASSESAAVFLSEKLAMQVSVVPIATNPSVFKPDVPKEDLTSDYCFTGSFWGHPRDIMYKLEPEALPFRFSVFGHGWNQVPAFAPYHRGKLPYSQMNDVYASTKIVIDDANSVTKQWDSVNSRVFDAIAAGALVITNGVNGAQSLFGDLLPTYQTRQDLESLLWRYLENQEERRTLVEKLRRCVLDKHTYGHRARQVLQNLTALGSGQRRIAIKIGAPHAKVKEEWGDYHFATALKRAFTRHGHFVRIDFLDGWNGKETIGDDIAIVLRGLSCYTPRPDQINLLWLISHPDEVSSSELEKYDHVFVASTRYAEELRSKIKTSVSELLQCTDPELFHKNVPEPEDKTNVLFVGNSRGVFRRIVQDAYKTGLDPSIYGKGWKVFLSNDRIKGEHIPNQELASHYAHAGVVLNDHWSDMRKKGFISNRLFDCLACGARVISDKVDGLGDLFGRFVATYDEADELRSMTERLVNESNEEKHERAEFAVRIRRDHSFDARVQEILHRIAEIEASKNLLREHSS